MTAPRPLPTGAHLFLLWQAESLKLLSRAGTRAALVVSVGIGLFGPILLWWLGTSAMIVNGTPLSDSLTTTAPMGAQWALELRNFFVFRVFLIMIASLSLAGEYQARTLREDLLRPVTRRALLLAKWGALVAFTALAAGLTWLTASVVGLVLFGTSGAWGAPALGYLATFATDAGFAALILAIAVILRSVAGTIAGVLLFMVLDTFLGWGLTMLSWVAQLAELPVALTVALQVRPWLPSAAFSAWVGATGRADWSWQSFVALGVLTAAFLLLAERTFARTDLP